MPLPVPRSARSCKYNGEFASEHGVFDSLVFQAQGDDQKADPEKRSCPKCGAPIEAMDNLWMTANWNSDLNGGEAFDYSPVFRLNTHVGIGPAADIDADLSDEGRLFSLQHFPAGTRFRGWVAIGGSGISLTDLGFEVNDKHHEIVLRVGRRSKTYGALRVQITCESCQNPWEYSHRSLRERFDHFQAAKGQIRKVRPDLHGGDGFVTFALTCLTDLILLDDFLRPCRSITAHQIAEYLCLNESAVERIALLTGTRIVGGWNAAHRLPKESDGAIVAGSAFLFTVNESILEVEDLVNRLTDLENSGVGWRRSEGFGQVLICDPFHVQKEREFTRFDGKKGSRPAVRLEPLQLSSTPRLEESLPFEREVWDFIVRNTEALHRSRAKVTKTQINSLRDRVQRYDLAISSEKDCKRHLKKYIEHAENRSKQGCWDLSEDWRESGKESLAQALIELFGLVDDTPWEAVRRRVDLFVKGAVSIVSSEKQVELREEGSQ